jgi:CO/xanthine dehydrogenase Mo-binding subunit
VDAHAIYTNNLPGGAFRGFGGPQATFQAEMQVNKLAELLEIDPVEFRMRNLFSEGSLMSVGSKIPEGVSIREVLEKCALQAGWQKGQKGWEKTTLRSNDGSKKQGLGIAVGYKNIGFSFGAPEKCNAKVRLLGECEIEKAILWHAGADVGQGSHSTFRQILAEALDLPVEKVELVASDTATSGNSGSASASRLTFMAGNSILGAAREVLTKWRNGERPAETDFTYYAPKTTPFSLDTGECYPNFAYGYVAEAVETEIDCETGEIKIDQVICVDDVGTAINPMQVEGQIEGAILQAVGYSTLENFIQKDGYVLTKLLSTYLIPTVLDIPGKVVALIHEHPDPLGPYGARGMAEMPYMPFTPALMDSVHSATGKWFDDFPLTSERFLRGIGRL